MAVSKCPCLNLSNVINSWMPKSHWFLFINIFIEPLTLLAPATNIEHTKPQRHIVHTLTPLTYELFFENSSTIKVIARLIKSKRH